jgi:uncharacterized RDD family membrane protein YckC
MADLFSENETTLILASKTKRFVAIFIDYFLYFIILYFLIDVAGNKYELEDGTVGFRLEGTPALISLIPWFLLLPILEGKTGQTIGKMILGIRVSKTNGSTITIGNAIVRHLFDIVDYLPFIGIVGLLVASNNELNQRVGDLVAKTIVVEK